MGLPPVVSTVLLKQPLRADKAAARLHVTVNDSDQITM